MAATETVQQVVNQRLAEMHDESMRCYNANYDNAAYQDAVRGKSVSFANRLLDEAMAFCGNPFFRAADRRRSYEEESFLLRFADWSK